MSDVPGNISDPKRGYRQTFPPRRMPQAGGANQPDEEHANQAPGLLTTVWPAVAGLILGFFAPRLYAAASGGNPWVAWLAFPYMFIAGRPEIGFSDELRRTLPQLILYIQFPIDGLLIMFSLRRRMQLGVALLQVFFLHFIGAFVLWLLSQSQ